MDRPGDGTDVGEVHSDLNTYLIHSIGGKDPAEAQRREFWGDPCRPYSGRSHVTANKRKKAKRKQAQTSRRKNRGL